MKGVAAIKRLKGAKMALVGRQEVYRAKTRGDHRHRGVSEPDPQPGIMTHQLYRFAQIRRIEGEQSVHASFNVIEQLTFRFDAQAGLDQPIELG